MFEILMLFLYLQNMKSAFPLANAGTQAIASQEMISRCLVVFSIAQQIMSFNHKYLGHMAFDTKGAA